MQNFIQTDAEIKKLLNNAEPAQPASKIPSEYILKCLHCEYFN